MLTIDPANLVGSAEAAKIAGMTTHALKMQRLRGRMPEPVARLECGPIWVRSQIEDWTADRAARRP